LFAIEEIQNRGSLTRTILQSIFREIKPHILYFLPF